VRGEQRILRLVAPAHNHQAFQRLLGRCLKELSYPLQSFAVEEWANDGKASFRLTR
jgi:hypothetical protein